MSIFSASLGRGSDVIVIVFFIIQYYASGTVK